SKKKRKNPFDPAPPEEEARTTEHKSPPLQRRKRDPFAPVTADALSNMPRPEADAAPAADGRRRKRPPRPTMLVAPLGRKPGVGPFCVDLYEYPGGNTMPRTDVAFAEAGRICAARGERLCSDGEWERACRGKGNGNYPYGHNYDAARCNVKGSGGEVAPAGSF